MTSDKVLIINPDVCLSATTTARSALSSRSSLRKNATFVQEQCTNDYLTPDLRFSDIRLLRRNQRYSFRNNGTNGIFPVVTLDSAIKFVKNLNANQTGIANKQVGLSIELQETEWYNKTYGLDVVNQLFIVLGRNNVTNLNDSNNSGLKVIISSYDLNDIIRLSNRTDLPLVLGVIYNITN